ncbi:MAG: hydroxymethylglutaryl-CoA lyase [Vicinamibacterales bacterium]
MSIPSLRGAQVTIVEVGARDGLQNEAAVVRTDDKVAFIDQLATAGLPVIEVGAFVNPKRVPQMGDTADVCARLARRSDVRYTALVPNLVGLDRAEAAGLADVAIFAAASEGFSRANINAGVDEAFSIYGEVCRQAIARGMRVRGYLSTAFGCPYDGEVAPARVLTLTQRLLDMGVYEVAVSDTIGVAHPAQVAAVLEVLTAAVPVERLALHFHDTRGTALANVLAGLLHGVRTFDAAAGGLGGCPFAPGAAGNLATEDLVYMLDGMGISTGVRLDRLVEASRFIGTRIGHPLPSRCMQAVAGTRDRS